MLVPWACAFVAAVLAARLLFDETDENAAVRLLENAVAELGRSKSGRSALEPLLERATSRRLQLRVDEAPWLAPGRAGLLELWAQAQKLEAFQLDFEVMHVDTYEDPHRVRALGRASWTFLRADERRSERRSIEAWLEGRGNSLRVTWLTVAGPTHEEPEPRP